MILLASVSSGILAIWPNRERRRAWTIADRRGCLVARVTSSFRTWWLAADYEWPRPATSETVTQGTARYVRLVPETDGGTGSTVMVSKIQAMSVSPHIGKVWLPSINTQAWIKNSQRPQHWYYKKSIINQILTKKVFTMTDHSKIVGLQTLLQNTCLNTHTQTCSIYTVSQKKLCHFYFYCNFGKCWSIFKILSMSESERNGS